MARIRELNLYQKGLLILLAAMVVIFGVVYSVFSSKVGYLYMDKVFLPSEENGSIVYSSTIKGEESRFIVTPKKEVIFQCGDKVYGPYTAKEDPTAIPKDSAFSEHMTGIEVKNGNEVIFRGGAFRISGNNAHTMLIGENESDVSHNVTTSINDGSVVDQMEPSVYVILELMDGPELTQKGQWIAWFCGVFISVMTAVSILYADELFRWNLSFRIRNAESAEPSFGEISGRYIAWTSLTIMALVLYIIGLQ